MATHKIVEESPLHCSSAESCGVCREGVSCSVSSHQREANTYLVKEECRPNLNTTTTTTTVAATATTTNNNSTNFVCLLRDTVG